MKAGGVSLTGQNSSIPATNLIVSPATGTYMLSLCLWVQTTNAGNSVVASVSYNNGTLGVSDSSTSVSLASTSNRSCTVVSQHIVNPTNVKYSTNVTGTGGSYGLDIVETRVQ